MYANIIIDDPLLRENYGFLNYRKLLNLMDRYNFHVTVAFIPWNYKRTDKNIAALFKDRPDRFSLCVHGCDHTGGEFGSTDLSYLDDKIKLATARMMEHERLTGVPFDRIMVFPQGVFTNEVLEVLKMNGYLAAVNTELPVNGQITSDFPFFRRYKPEDVRDCFYDPTFIVLHHDYFKNGYDRLTDFVDDLNTQSNNVKWDSLGNIVRSLLSVNEIDYKPVDIDLSGLKFHGYKENVKISLRRYASEFRDNYLCKNDSLLNRAKQIKKAISK